MIRILVLALVIGACAPVAPTPSPNVACKADAAQLLVGTPFTTRRGERAQRLATARTLRVIRPGQAVTMDYREDRLNVELDAGNRITAIRCG